MGVYNYHTQTPASKQWEDFKNDMTNVNKWEEATSFGITMIAGGYGAMSKAGVISKGSGIITKVPIGVTLPKVNYFLTIRNGYGIIDEKGFIIRNYKIEWMYKNAGGGTIFSITLSTIGSTGLDRNSYCLSQI